MDDKAHGDWVERSANGDVGEGPIVDGKVTGDWVFRSADGNVWEGPYVDNEKNGYWVERSANGNVWEGPYVDGGRHGRWVFRWADGVVFEGPFVNGELTGDWALRFPDGTVDEGPYANFGRHNQWVIRWPNWPKGKVWEGSYQEARKRTEAAMAALEEAVEESRRIAEEARKARRRAETAISGMEFVWVPPGEFRMGSKSSEADDDERPRMRVRISRGFFLGKYEVTQGQWEAVMGSNPSRFDGCGPDCPVENVSWDDVQEFIRRLNAREGGNRYRLPTEAEWEYAARAGTNGDHYGNLAAIAWHEDNSGNRTHPVGRKAPNEWGLYDMLGNVWEWVEDWYGGYPGGRSYGSQGAWVGLVAGDSGRLLVQRRQDLPGLESQPQLTRRPPPRPWLPPAEDRITICSITLLRYAKRRKGGREAAPAGASAPVPSGEPPGSGKSPPREDAWRHCRRGTASPAAARPATGREPAARRIGSENRWLCQLRSAVVSRLDRNVPLYVKRESSSSWL